MLYPELCDVENADREQLCRWQRFLPSPGSLSVGENDFEERMEREKVVLDAILMRIRLEGGFTPELSKKIGWEE